MKSALGKSSLGCGSVILVGIIAQWYYSAIYLGGRPRIPATQCLSNVKRIATMMTLYAIDFNDRMPAAEWQTAIRQYEKGWRSDYYSYPFSCPDVSWEGYALNSAVAGKRLSGDREVLTFETDALGSSVIANLAARAQTRHKGGSNIGYSDTSAKWKPKDR